MCVGSAFAVEMNVSSFLQMKKKGGEVNAGLCNVLFIFLPEPDTVHFPHNITQFVTPSADGVKYCIC